jgi:hypothetical protein
MENIWAILKGHLKTSYATKSKLKLEIRKVWNEIDPEIIDTLYDSMPKRIQEVIKRKG